METLKLKSVRQDKGLTKTELSRLSGISRATITSLESGKGGTTTLQTLKALANALQVNVSDLF